MKHCIDSVVLSTRIIVSCEVVHAFACPIALRKFTDAVSNVVFGVSADGEVVVAVVVVVGIAGGMSAAFAVSHHR